MTAHSLGLSGISFSTTAGSKIGPHHVQNGMPNQDAFDFIEGPGLVTLAVADGAGSLEHSKDGAEIAVEAAVGMAADLIIQSSGKVDLVEILKEAMVEARNAVKTHPQWREAGCTLVLAAFTEESFAVGVVGDSFAVLETDDSVLHLVQPPSVGEFANITKLLTSDNFTFSIASGSTRELHSIALCSDAFEQSTLEKRIPTAGFWSKVFSMAWTESLKIEELIDFMDRQGKIEDDATMIVGTVSRDTEETKLLNSHEPLLFQEFSLKEIESVTSSGSTSEESNASTSLLGPLIKIDGWKQAWDSTYGPKGLPTKF